MSDEQQSAERWHVEIRWREGAGAEHVMSGQAGDVDGARMICAGALEALDELFDLLDKDTAVTAPARPAHSLGGEQTTHEIVRDLWHYRLSWTDPVDGLSHVGSDWTTSGSELWLAFADDIVRLLDLREVLRQTRYRAPRPL